MKRPHVDWRNVIKDLTQALDAIENAAIEGWPDHHENVLTRTHNEPGRRGDLQATDTLRRLTTGLTNINAIADRWLHRRETEVEEERMLGVPATYTTPPNHTPAIPPATVPTHCGRPIPETGRCEVCGGYRCPICGKVGIFHHHAPSAAPHG